MSTSDGPKSDTEEPVVVAPLAPAYVEGTTQGSVYKVVVRTAHGFIAIRRLSELTFRVRAQRFDRHWVFPEKLPPQVLNALKACGLAPKEGYISGIAAGVYSLQRAISVLTGLLFVQEFDIDELKPESPDEALIFERLLQSNPEFRKFHGLEEEDLLGKETEGMDVPDEALADADTDVVVIPSDDKGDN